MYIHASDVHESETEQTDIDKHMQTDRHGMEADLLTDKQAGRQTDNLLLEAPILIPPLPLISPFAPILSTFHRSRLIFCLPDCLDLNLEPILTVYTCPPILF